MRNKIPLTELKNWEWIKVEKSKLNLRDGLIYRSRSSRLNVWHHIYVKKRETWVRSLGEEDPLEEEMATHSGILAWRIPMGRGAWGAPVHGLQRDRHDWLNSAQCSTYVKKKMVRMVFVQPQKFGERKTCRSISYQMEREL